MVEYRMARGRFAFHCFHSALLLTGAFAIFLALAPFTAQAQNPFAQWTQQGAGVPPEGSVAPSGSVLQPGSLSSPTATLESIFEFLAKRQVPLRVNLWFPGVSALTDIEIAQGAAIAQGIALRTGNLPIDVTAVAGIVPGAFNVVVGDVLQLRQMLSREEAAAVSNGYLLLRRVAEKADTHTLLITGRTASGVNSAILMLGIARVQLPLFPTAAIRDVVLPNAPPFLRREPLRPETTYTFRHLQEQGTGITMLPNRHTLQLEIMLPGDYSPAIEGNMRLEIFYSGRAGSVTLGGGDRVVVKANDGKVREAATASMDSERQRATMELPLNEFAPGRNLIEVDFQRHDGDAVGLYMESSTLALPPCTAPPVLPNLEIAALTAYPFIGQPDGSEISVFLADRSLETIEATWTLMTRLAQVSNTLHYAAEYTFKLAPTTRHLIVVGPRASLPENLASLVPKLVFEEPKVETKPVVDGVNLKEAIMWGRQAMFDQINPTPTPTPSPVLEEQPRPKKERGFLLSAPPRENEHGWVLMLTAETPALLKARTSELIQPGWWQRLGGESVFWSDLKDSLTIYRDQEQQSLAGIPIGRPEDQVEMPLGERFTFHAWTSALIVTFLVFIVSAYYSITRTNYNRNNLSL